MGLPRLTQSGSGKDIEADTIGVERLFLPGVVGGEIVPDGTVKAVPLQVLIADFDRGAVAVGAGDEQHLLRADPVAQEPGIDVCVDKYPADVPEMQVLVSIGHPAGDNGALRKYRPAVVCAQSYRLL